MLRILQEVLAMKGLSCCYDLSDMLKAKLQFIGHEFVKNFYKVFDRNAKTLKSPFLLWQHRLFLFLVVNMRTYVCL